MCIYIYLYALQYIYYCVQFDVRTFSVSRSTDREIIPLAVANHISGIRSIEV